MKQVNWLLLILLFAFFGVVYAQESQVSVGQDLSSRLQAEADGYIEQITTLRGQPLIDTADLITGSGLSNAELYSAVEAKINILSAQHSAEPRRQLVAEELSAVLRTLASINPKSERVINNLIATSTSRGVRNRGLRLLPKLYWFSERNNLMQKPDFYVPGQDLMTHRYLNLIESNDPRNSRWAAEEIDRRGSAEQVVYERMAEIVEQEYLNVKNDIHLDSLAWFCKLLAKYDTQNSATLLNTIRANPRSHKKLRKYAKI